MTITADKAKTLAEELLADVKRLADSLEKFQKKWNDDEYYNDLAAQLPEDFRASWEADVDVQMERLYRFNSDE